MKIEKVNDHQIRCTLTKADLAERELKISELAYGTDKAKDLFRDMMQQASFEFGFEAEDIPLMIEAIPLNSECIVLIITKVEDPEELDTRFSKFAPSVREEEETPVSTGSIQDDVLDLFKKLHDDVLSNIESIPKVPAAEETSSTPKETEAVDEELTRITHIFTFRNMGELTRGARMVAEWFDGESSLYKDPVSQEYKLIVRLGNATPESYNKTCNVLSEYGRCKRFSEAGKAYFEEHNETLCQTQALQSLALI